MIVDCHGHFNTQRDFIRNAAKFIKYKSDKRRYDFALKIWNNFEQATSFESWTESLDRYGVDKVLLQTAPYGGNDSVAEFVKKRPDRFIGLANIDFTEPDISNSVRELERCSKELGLKGIGELYPQVGSWNPGDEKYFPIYEKAEELGMPIMIHAGTEGRPLFNDERYSDPYMLDPALRAFPELPFIVCHMAQEFVLQLFVLMNARPNLYTEVSSLSVGVSLPYYNFFEISRQHVFRKFLERGYANRIIWGTDVQAPYNSDIEKNKVKGTVKDNPFVTLMEELSVCEQDRANMMGETARILFKL